MWKNLFSHGTDAPASNTHNITLAQHKRLACSVQRLLQRHFSAWNEFNVVLTHQNKACLFAVVVGGALPGRVLQSLRNCSHVAFKAPFHPVGVAGCKPNFNARVQSNTCYGVSVWERMGYLYL